MRLDRPKGFINFWLPHVMGSVLAALINDSSPQKLIKANLILLMGTFWLRGATCTWNDIVDVDFDRQVARTRNRPLARGAVKTPAALVLMAVHTVAAAMTLQMLPPRCTLYSVPSILGWIVYPLMKRVSNYPQVFLGFPVAWGVLMGACAMGLDPLSFDQGSHSLFESSHFTILLLYAAHVAWTITYEIIYSYQDYADDRKAGVKSLTLLLGDKGKYLLASVSAIHIIILVQLGVTISASGLYFIGCVFGVTTTLMWEVYDVNLADPFSCQWWFGNGGMITGFVWLGGLLAEYLIAKPPSGFH
ncbi:MAG: hypothetical protein Q9162_006586 [Coniocarpon cinnabarinum]